MGNCDYIYFLSMEKILLVSIGQWQVGEGRLTNSAVATESILYSFLSFLKLPTVKKTLSQSMPGRALGSGEECLF